MGDIEMRPSDPGQAGLSVRSFRKQDLVRWNTCRLAQQSAQDRAGQGEHYPILRMEKPVCPVLFGGGKRGP
jgi:hypothetical protein